jgi:hypothetical protein
MESLEVFLFVVILFLYCTIPFYMYAQFVERMFEGIKVSCAFCNRKVLILESTPLEKEGVRRLFCSNCAGDAFDAGYGFCVAEYPVMLKPNDSIF